MKKRITILAVVAAITLVVSFPAIKPTLKATEPFRSVYIRFCNARGMKHPILLPSQVGDGGKATTITLQDPVGIGEDSRGNVYVADRGRFIWQIDPRGVARIVAGTGVKGTVRTGTSALVSDLGCPQGLCVDASDNIYFVDSTNHLVLKIDSQGILHRIAGTGRAGFSGDGGPASAAALNDPFDIRFDSQGNLYVADFGNHCIRKIDQRGVITTVAGTGASGYTGDHGPATEAELNGPYGIALDAEDNLLIADSLNHVIRKVGIGGVIVTIAGSGTPGYSGDGGPALAATFNTPQSVLVTTGGELLVGDEHNHAIRRIDLHGIISTLLGNGARGSAPDGQTTSQTPLNDPEAIWARADGTILVSEGGNGRVRSLSPEGVIKTFAGSGRLSE